jgi:hypothetical protein
MRATCPPKHIFLCIIMLTVPRKRLKHRFFVTKFSQSSLLDPTILLTT